jgi:hypothetical protein
MARSMRAGAPRTVVSSAVIVKAICGWWRWARSTALATSRSRRTPSVSWSCSSPRARSTTSPTSTVISSSCETTSASSRRRISSGMPFERASTFDVGTQAGERCSKLVIRLKARASRPSSSLRCTVRRSERSCVCATFSAVVVSRPTGRSAVRAINAASVAAAMPAAAISSRGCSQTRQRGVGLRQRPGGLDSEAVAERRGHDPKMRSADGRVLEMDTGLPLAAATALLVTGST